VSQTSRSNARPVKGDWNSPSAPERASLLRLTLWAQSRSQTGTAPFKTSRRDISITQKILDVLRDDPPHVPGESHQGQVGGRDNVLAGGFDDRLNVNAVHLELHALISVAVVTL